MPQGRKRKVDATSDKATVEEEFFTKKSWLEDLTLVVEGKKMHVSKAVLALASPVFTTMFESDFLEKNKEEIELKGKKYKDMVEFLQSIYPSTRKSVTIDTVFQILPLADEYQVDSLKKDCEQCLMLELSARLSHTSCMNVCRFLQQAALYGLDKLEEKCIEELRHKAHREIDLGESFFPLPLDCKNKLLVQQNLQLEESLKLANQNIEQLKREKKNMKNDLYKRDYYERELKRRDEFFEKEEDLAVQGIIKLNLENVTQMDSRKFSKPKKLRGVEWTLKAEKFIEEGKTYLSTWVTFEPDRPHMICFAEGTFILIAKEKNNLEWVLKDVTFSSTSCTWGCQKLIEWSDFIDPENGYVIDDKASLHVFMMVQEPHEA